MTRPFPFGRALAGLFVVINVAGAAMAIAEGNAMHACVHLVLLAPGVFLLWRLVARQSASARGAELPADVAAFVEQVMRLERSIDAVAIEMERVGEGQRHMLRMLGDKDVARAPN